MITSADQACLIAISKARSPSLPSPPPHCGCEAMVKIAQRARENVRRTPSKDGGDGQLNGLDWLMCIACRAINNLYTRNATSLRLPSCVLDSDSLRAMLDHNTMRKSPVDVYALLRRRIVLGEFPADSQLKELHLAEEFGVSRTPLRSAFKRLEQDGLVFIKPNHGVFVAAWTLDDDDEVFDLRILIEAHAAELAAARRLPEHVQRLHALNDRMAALSRERPEDFLAQMETLNRDFHGVIAQAAASRRLSTIMTSLFTALRLTGYFFASDAEIEESLGDHRALARAIERGDGKLAHALLATHIQHTWDRMKAQRQRTAAGE